MIWLGSLRKKNGFVFFAIRCAGFLVGLLLGSFCHGSSMEGMLRDGIISSIKWEMFWFGSSLGAECIDQKKANVDYKVFVPNFDENIDKRYGVKHNVSIYIDGSRTTYAGTLWHGKATFQPAAGGDGCMHGVGISANRRLDYRSGNVLFFSGDFSSLNEKYQPKKPSSQLVNEYVKNSLIAYLGGDDVRKRTFYLAYYTPDDPFLLLVDFDAGDVFMVDFPSLLDIKKGYVGSVYNVGIFLGGNATREDYQAAIDHCFELLKKFSIRLGAAP